MTNSGQTVFKTNKQTNKQTTHLMALYPVWLAQFDHATSHTTTLLFWIHFSQSVHYRVSTNTSTTNTTWSSSSILCPLWLSPLSMTLV